MCLVELVILESSIIANQCPIVSRTAQKKAAALGRGLPGALGWALAVVLSRASRGLNHSQALDYKCWEVPN